MGTNTDGTDSLIQFPSDVYQDTPDSKVMASAIKSGQKSIKSNFEMSAIKNEADIGILNQSQIHINPNQSNIIYESTFSIQGEGGDQSVDGTSQDIKAARAVNGTTVFNREEMKEMTFSQAEKNFDAFDIADSS